MTARGVTTLIRTALAEHGIYAQDLGATERQRKDIVALFARDVVSVTQPQSVDKGPAGASKARARTTTTMLHPSSIHKLYESGGDSAHVARVYRLWLDQQFDPAWRYLKANAGAGFGEADRPVRFDAVHLPVRPAGRAAYLLSLLRQVPVHLEIGGERFVVDAKQHRLRGPLGITSSTVASILNPPLDTTSSL